MNLELEGKCALIVGATGGIGSSVAHTLAQEGVHLVLAARREAPLKELANELQGCEPDLYSVDLSIGSSVAELDKQVTAAGRPVDILVCAAAVPSFGEVWQFPRDEWEENFAVKYFGVADLCRRIAQQMMTRRSGTIIVLTGIAAHLVMGTNPAGGGANAALENFVRVLSASAGQHGVRVLGVSPGMTLTGRLTAFAENRLDKVAAATPLRRLANPNEIADVIAFLASPRAGFMTGTTVVVDGGLCAARQDLAWNEAMP